MQIHSLETFYWVTRLSSFRRAAEVLNISQPTVSSRIRGLEEELGVVLLHRDSGLTLTEQGQELLDYARKILRLTEDLSFHQPATPVETRLRIGANGPVAATWLMRLIERLEHEHPAARIEIESEVLDLADEGLGHGVSSKGPAVRPATGRCRRWRCSTAPSAWAAGA